MALRILDPVLPWHSSGQEGTLPAVRISVYACLICPIAFSHQCARAPRAL